MLQKSFNQDRHFGATFKNLGWVLLQNWSWEASASYVHHRIHLLGHITFWNPKSGLRLLEML